LGEVLPEIKFLKSRRLGGVILDLEQLPGHELGMRFMLAMVLLN
jgi:hypothetical protein